MKKRMYFIELIFLFILSCSNNKTNKKEQQTIVDSTDISVNDIIKDVSSENIIEKRGKYIIPTQIIDSIIGGYHIYYEYLINITELIPTKSITKVTGDTLYFAGTDIQLLLNKNGKRYFQKCFNKDVFSPYMQKEDIPKYSITSMHIEQVKEDSIFFSLNLTIPDTDFSYDFEIIITDDGKMNIKEVMIESEMFE
ncbi:MAG: DUF4738 domain-containing protein [Bacteroides sp.]|nr:DUF4738 domain-containing protein [Bacteroides sp.]